MKSLRLGRSVSVSCWAWCLMISSILVRSVTSRAMQEVPTMAPSPPRIGDRVSETWMRPPSFLTCTVSKWVTCSSLRIARCSRVISSLLSGGARNERCLPFASRAS